MRKTENVIEEWFEVVEAYKDNRVFRTTLENIGVSKDIFDLLQDVPLKILQMQAKGIHYPVFDRLIDAYSSVIKVFKAVDQYTNGNRKQNTN